MMPTDRPANPTPADGAPAPDRGDADRDGAARDAPTRDIVVMGASAGGIEAFRQVLADLPADYDGTVCVVLHIPPSVPSVLAHILDRATRLVCVSAYDGAPVRPGVVYVAPPDHHMLLEPGRVRLLRGPRENGHRPAVDPLFRSAAAAYGPRIAGVVLSGNLDDGTRGLLAIKRHGGLAVAQAPEDAAYPGMPQHAVAHVPVDYVLPAFEIGALLASAARGALTAEPNGVVYRTSHTVTAGLGPTRTNGRGKSGPPAGNASVDGPPVHPAHDLPPETVMYDVSSDAPEPPPAPVQRVADLATGIGRVNGGARINESLGGVVSAFTCPECRGALWEIREGELARFRCRVGHSYTEPGLVDNKARAVEEALWTALTALEESAAIAARMADRAVTQGHAGSAARFRERADFLEQRGALLREVLADLPGHVDGA